MNKELLKLYEWICINRLSLNITKTNFVIFHAKNKTKSPVTILTNNKAIDEVEEVKYLGIIIDSSVYYAIIYPFLLYGITIWGNAEKNLLTAILTLQNTFVRMATYNDSLPESPGALVKALPLFHRLKILTIFHIYNLQVGKLVFESINEIGPTQSIIEFTLASDIHHHNTRYANHSNFYSKGVTTTQFGLKNLINEGSKLWATIPNNIKNCPSRISFNKCYKKFMILKY